MKLITSAFGSDTLEVTDTDIEKLSKDGCLAIPGLTAVKMVDEPVSSKEKVEELVIEIANARFADKSHNAIAHELNTYIDQWIDELYDSIRQEAG